MVGQRARVILYCFLLNAILLSGCGGQQANSKPQEPELPKPVTLAADSDGSEATIRFLEDRVKNDKDDFISLNKLAGYYLQRVRETGNLNYLELAARAANSSLKAIPAEQNTGGLMALAQAEFAAHEFVQARDHARQLIELDARKPAPYFLLGDACLELGDYDEARRVFHNLEKREVTGYGMEVRAARLALLKGDIPEARRRFANAVIFAENQSPPSRETLAWTRWQLGEAAFAGGDYEGAEKHYRDSLITFPGYFRALASLGRVLAARGDIAGAIEQYQRAIEILPDPGFVAALGDLYSIAGREKEAQLQYNLVEQISKLSQANGVLYNRQLAIFYADHDLKPEEAYNQARLEYEKRRDIYGADALAWTALKAGRLDEAQTAIKEALKLGTRDAKLLYHAAMIAKAANNANLARDYLQSAVALNPQFDPLQSANARKLLEDR